jgi:CRISPR-associated protein Csb2
VPTLLINFSGRRYHATPWGHHVNEGLVEWPPSPWRLLRALLATGYTKLGWPGDGPPKAARDLIDKLATTLPRYRLPSAAGAHSRHYMPLAVLDKGREKTTMVFDTWAQVDDGVLAVHWDVVLAEEETETLRAIAENLGYLGRSESWVTASLAADDSPIPEGTDAMPCEDGVHRGPGWEQIPLLAPVSSSDYVNWRRAALDDALSRLADVDLTKKKLTKGEKKKVDTLKGSYPPHLLACLQVETKWLRKLGWSQPPGSRRVFYWRKADTLEVGAARPKQRYIEAAPVEAMLLSMATASGNDHALPNIIRTLPQAELLHRDLVSLACHPSLRSVALIGCDEQGRPLRQEHQHAHLLPLDLDGDGHLEHILIWAPMGLDGQAQAAIRAVRRTFTKGGTGRLRLALAAIGSLLDLAQLPEPYGTRLVALLGPATTWRSLTPFVPPRHLKKQGRHTLEGQIVAELESRGHPVPNRVSVLDLRNEGLLRYRHFVRARRFGPTPPIDCCFALELEFEEPVHGPLVLGYGCHFGLGLFGSN